MHARYFCGHEPASCQWGFQRTLQTIRGMAGVSSFAWCEPLLAIHFPWGGGGSQGGFHTLSERWIGFKGSFWTLPSQRFGAPALCHPRLYVQGQEPCRLVASFRWCGRVHPHHWKLHLSPWQGATGQAEAGMFHAGCVFHIKTTCE